MNFVEILNKILAASTILMQVAIVVLVVSALIYKKEKLIFSDFIVKNSTWIFFAISFFAVALSLFYSEVVGYQPCSLCWIQRIFIYPIAVIAGIALWHRNSREDLSDYVIGLSIFGAVFALYHHLIQMGLVPSVFCVASAVSCAKRYVFEFGFVTMPLMSFTLFVGLIVLAFLIKMKTKE